MGAATGVDLDVATLARLERAENFPVAMRVLPRRIRADLRAAYGVARLIDDIGDDPARTPAERLASLDAVVAALQTVEAGAGSGIRTIDAIGPTVAAGRLPVAPLLALVEANRLDQTVRRYPTYADLRHYCSLSADPVGRIVLAVFGVRDDRAVALSDSVCTALQILEHCQDVAEDRRDHDRIYLPLEDLDRFGVDEDALDASATSAGLVAAVAMQVDRAEQLLEDGGLLVGMLRGWSRVAVAGYVAGGRATVDAIRRAHHDVLAATPRPRPRDVARHLARLLVGSR